MIRHHVKQLALLSTTPVYTVSFEDTALLPHGKREHSAQGKVALVATDGARVRNDFDAIPIFDRPICNATWDSESRRWCDFVWQGEPGFSWSPTEAKREVLYRCRPFYYQLDMRGESTPVRVSVSEAPLPGFRLAPMFDNGRDFVYRPAFAMGCDADNIPHSRAGLVPYRSSAMALTKRASLFDAAARCERTADWFSDLLLQWVEFATRDLGSVMRGANPNYKIHSAIYQKGDAPNLLRVSATVAAQLSEGMTLQCKTGESAFTVDVMGFEAMSDGSVAVRMSERAVSDDEEYVDDSSISVTTTVQPWRAGAILPLLNASSGIRSARNGIHGPCSWRGKENPWGNTGSLLFDLSTCRNAHSGAGVYHLSDPLAWEGGSTTLSEAWQKISDITFGVVSGKIKSFRQSTDKPFVIWPTVTPLNDKITYYGAQAVLTGVAPATGIFAGVFQSNVLQNNPATLRSMILNATYQYGGARLVLFEERN